MNPGQHKFGALASVLSGVDVISESFSPNTPKRDKQARYQSLMRGINILSYSTFGNFHACERKFALNKLEKAAAHDRGTNGGIVMLENNIDFAYGRCVETGVQGALLGKSDQDVFWDMFLAWDMPIDAVHPKYSYGNRKSFVDCTIMIDRFKLLKGPLFENEGWEVAFFNGKPAIELSFIIDLENGWYYAGHVDLIMWNRHMNIYRVLENKSTGATYVHPAMYKNSDQALGYSIVLDSIASDVETTGTFEVQYLVFMTKTSEIKLFDFTKARSNRAGWINTLLLDIQRINIYRSAGYWPKRGGSCFDYSRPCPYFDTCDLDFSNFNPTGDFSVLTEEEVEEHTVDFKFKLSEIIATQQELI